MLGSLNLDPVLQIPSHQSWERSPPSTCWWCLKPSVMLLGFLSMGACCWLILRLLATRTRVFFFFCKAAFQPVGPQPADAGTISHCDKYQSFLRDVYNITSGWIWGFWASFLFVLQVILIFLSTRFHILFFWRHVGFNCMLLYIICAIYSRCSGYMCSHSLSGTLEGVKLGMWSPLR